MDGHPAAYRFKCILIMNQQNIYKMKMPKQPVWLLIVALLAGFNSYGGNPQRIGQSGASELLINPWAGSAGWNGVNISNVSGLEAMYVNIAGTALKDGLEVGFTNVQWLVDTDLSINSAGLVTRVGSGGALSASFTVVDYGEWDIAIESDPDGNLGTISPSTAVIGLGYAQAFAKSIYGGIRLNLYSTTNDNLSVSALTIDAGIQYISRSEDLKFGITLKNVGPSTNFEGDGLSISLPVPQGGFSQAFDQRSADFEMPTALSLGGSYNFDFDDQRLTMAAAFRSNSFESDQYVLGAEYGIKDDLLAIRGSYTFYNNKDINQQVSIIGNISAGLSVKVPLSENRTKFLNLSYAYRTTDILSGIHYFGGTFDL